MKRFIELAAAAALALSLAGCTLPGEQVQDDDFLPTMSYSDVKDDTDEEAVVNYAWSLKPTVSADNIIVFDASQVDTNAFDYNDMYKNVAVISRGGLYGLIDYKGELIVKPSYKYYYLCSCGQVVLYNITDEENDVREYCTLDKDGKKVDYITEHQSTITEYYFDESKSKTYYAKEADGWSVYEYTGEQPVVACKASISLNGSEYYISDKAEEPKYALVKKDKALTDFEFDAYYAPAFKDAKDTAIAVKKDGKWGYLKSNGKQLIDFRCDELFSTYNGEKSDSLESGHPYLFSEEMVPVSISFSFGYYNIDGQCVVRTNEFEQARPVHNGKAWVCTEGLWGVIRFGDEPEEEAVTMTTTTTTTKASWSATTSSSAASTTTNATTQSSDVLTDDTTPTDPVWTDTEPVWTDTEPVWTDTEPVWTDTEPAWTDTEPVYDPGNDY